MTDIQNCTLRFDKKTASDQKFAKYLLLAVCSCLEGRGEARGKEAGEGTRGGREEGGTVIRPTPVFSK